MTVLAWATPTRRAMRWRPLFVTTSVIAAVVLTSWAASAPPMAEPPEMIAITMLIAAAALALDDPAHALVAAAPVGFARRLTHRLAWLGPTTLGVLCGIGWIAWRLDVATFSGPVLARSAALGSVAVATHVCVARRRPDVAASVAAVVPAVWVTFGVSAPRSAWGGTVAHLWLDRPWTVLACAVAVVAVAARRR